MIEHFSLKLGIAEPAAELQAWMERAAPGDRRVYATGLLPHYSPRESEAHALVSAWVERGAAITTTAAHDTVKGRKNWLVVKASPAPAVDQDSGWWEQGRALLAWLGGQCARGPRQISLVEMAWVLGLPARSGRQRARYLLRQLERKGLVSTSNTRPRGPIVVGVTAAGKAAGLKKVSRERRV